jgi:hypothetical protein
MNATPTVTAGSTVRIGHERRYLAAMAEDHAETARHLGHLDTARELLDGRTGLAQYRTGD